ncbi:MAG: ribonuclease HII, partial [Patescibacteria group bacterium]
MSLVGEKIVDRLGIVWAIKIGIRRCLEKLKAQPEQGQILLDGGLVAPAEYRWQKTIIRGDENIPVIALASIAAKVTRDRRMI